MKALFVVGIIFLIIIIGFALLIIVPRIVGGIGGAASALTSFFRGANGEGISLTTSSTMVKTGEKFTIDWDDADAKSTTDYVISYTCDEDLSISFDGKKSACDKGVSLNGSDNEVTIVPTFTAKDDYEDVTFEVTAIEGGDEVRSGQVVVTVVNGSPVLPDDNDDSDDNDDEDASDDDNDDATYDSNDSNVEIKKSTTKPTVTVAKGKANLAIVNLRMGRWDEGVFTETNRVEEDEIGGAMFTVVNDGGVSSGSWTLSYTEPTDQKETRVVAGQPSVPAGTAFDYTIVFPSYGDGMKSTTVTVDSANQVAERNEYDNSSTDTIVFAESNDGSQNSGGTSHGNGDADLKATIDAVGRLSGRSFVETHNLDTDDEVAIRFLISNVGGESTGSWRFTVKMSGDDSQTYRSASQPSLKPGQVAEYVLGFDGIDDDAEEVKFTVEADSSDDVDEERENNNTDSESVDLD
jgi:hypothetical protein